ncbi:MAG: periplasmic heavy metal sensor [Deltaproteobacteria bacterium]|jgi:Spy/CpxP family protein refolding chaperone|nr:periplasmic heavy metal sensor [Deltaproteobacteria bacterium]
MKNPRFALTALAAAAFAASLAFAGVCQAQDGPPPPGHGSPSPHGPGGPPPGPGGPPPPPGDDGGGPPTLTDEQRAQRRQLFQEYLDKADPVREDLRDQKFIYEALAGNPNASLQDIRDTVAQMRRLRDQLRTLRKEFRDKYRESGLPPWSFRERPDEPGDRSWGDDRPDGRRRDQWRGRDRYRDRDRDHDHDRDRRGG